MSFKKCPKINQKFAQNRKALVIVIYRGMWRCLKRKRDIAKKATFSDVKTVFRQIPASIQFCVFKSALFLFLRVLPIPVLFPPFFTVVFFFLLSHDRQLRCDLFDGGECR